MPLQIDAIVSIPASRRAILPLSPDTLVALLKDLVAGHRIVATGLPDDARVVGTHYDEMRDLMLLELKSARFAEVPDNELAPTVDIKFTVHRT